VTAPGKVGEAKVFAELPAKNAAAGQIDNQPDGMCLDAAGNLYVADYYFNTIRKGSVTPSILSSGPAFGFRDGHFGFGIAASAGKLVVIDASTDLTNWQPILTNTVTAGLELTDPQSDSRSDRFYRFRLP
jgi:hypothetical protein